MLFVLATGCPAVHGTDAGLDAGNASFDAGPGSPDASMIDGSVVDAAVEPERCSADDMLDCYCWAEDPRRGPAYCITPRGAPIEVCDVGNGCSTSDHLCNDLAAPERGFPASAGVCVSLSMCAWLRARDSRTRCYYEDGTLYDTGVLASAPCDAADSGLVCGPGCGECPGGRECVGVSERSGLGLCVRTPVAESPDRCGEGYASCGSDQRCVGFVLPEGVSFARAERVWHRCVARETCTRLAEWYPDRFYCRG